jgi:hypothetical protein
LWAVLGQIQSSTGLLQQLAVAVAAVGRLQLQTVLQAALAEAAVMVHQGAQGLLVKVLQVAVQVILPQLTLVVAVAEQAQSVQVFPLVVMVV